MVLVKHRVLLIDDDRDVLFFLKETLEEKNFECITALSSVDGLKKAKSEKPDVILLDLMLPQMSGYGVLRELKDDPLLQKIPVVILTSLKDNEVAMGAMNLGASGYLHKSCDPQTLLSTVQEFAFQ